MLNAFPYLGKDETRLQDVGQSFHVVMKITAPYLGKGRNITVDNFFTSVKLANALKQKRTTLVGTLNKVRKEVPAELKCYSGDLHSTKLFKSCDMSLTVYQGKKSKHVLLLSTMHPSVDVIEEGKKIPETIAYYNKTKCGVDVVDQMARKYTVRAGTRRWPVHTFYNILDLAGINAHIIFNKISGKKMSRRTYLQKLIEELSSSYMESKGTQMDGNELEDSVDVIASKDARKHNCQIQKNCNKKTKSIGVCSACKKWTCGQCVTRKRMFCAVCSMPHASQ